MDTLEIVIVIVFCAFYLLLLLACTLYTCVFCCKRKKNKKIIEQKMQDTKQVEITAPKIESYEVIEKLPQHGKRTVQKSTPKYRTVTRTRPKYRQVPYEDEETYTDYEYRDKTVYYTETEYRDEMVYKEFPATKEIWGYNYYNVYCVLRTEPTTEWKYVWTKKPYTVNKTKNETEQVPVTKTRKCIKYQSVPDGEEEYTESVPDGYRYYNEEESYVTGYTDKKVTKYRTIQVGTGKYNNIPAHDRHALEKLYLEGYTFTGWLKMICFVCALANVPFFILNIVFMFLRNWTRTNVAIFLVILANLMIGFIWSFLLCAVCCGYVDKCARKISNEGETSPLI
jgi:hypothetical protein